MTDDTAEMLIKELRLSNNTASDETNIVVAGKLTLRAATFSKPGAQEKGVSIAARVSLTTDKQLDCTRVQHCRFLTHEAQLHGFRCPVGTGISDGSNATGRGCVACPPGQTQTSISVDSPCRSCPDGAKQCFAGHLQMQRGLMVEDTEVSRTLHCPNEAACPGGQLPAGLVPMCETGYVGEGCAACAEGHAMEDSSVLSCTECSKVGRTQVLQWAVFAAQRSVLFFLAAASAQDAKAANELKRSGIYLNQLMAFATISTTILAGVLQTKTAKEMKSQAVTVLFDAAMVAAETGSGQGALGSASSQCLLSYIGFGTTLFGAHLLEMATATLLVLVLGLASDIRLALVAGINCFLPSIAAGFGKYMVCYRLEPDNVSAKQGLICPFLPGTSRVTGFTQVCGGLAICLMLTLYAWLRLSTSAEDPLPRHVIFLTSKYKTKYALFETERLLRKTLFTLIGAVLPVTASPALQMGFLGIVVLSSLILYGAFQPYHTQAWNRSEISLLATATYMIFMVSSLLANEFHWGHSENTQQVIIVSTIVTASTVISIMLFRVLKELAVERTRPSKPPGAGLA